MRISIPRTFAAHLPQGLQRWLRRFRVMTQARIGRLGTSEPEYFRLGDWIRPGDWVLDIGANIGDYTCRLSKLVGAGGRVIAFEPVPSTFALLTAVLDSRRVSNVTLINAAASSIPGQAYFSVPRDTTGVPSYYRAYLTADHNAGLPCLAVSVDALALPKRVSFAKIDAEGHEVPALEGMMSLVARDRPILVVEGSAAAHEARLEPLGYRWYRLPSSPNVVFEPRMNPISSGSN